MLVLRNPMYQGLLSHVLDWWLLHHPAVLPSCSLLEAKEGLMKGTSLFLPSRTLYPCIPQPVLFPTGFFKVPY